ncbi:hypothetical protein KY290_031064 [Solanum tuberosum]|uniref:Uncharacterized protein n=1 Tax=Solanum tuberosum TaxID=4113 RepID=A0ABQ7U9P4_SOLTU|nr:hypothetical protein KY290_031064 [Solanum tuberosum]
MRSNLGMSRGSFPLKYLGCPITHLRKNKEHYTYLFDRVRGKLQAWKGKMLSVGGGSQVWKYMLENRERLEQHLRWEPKGGTSNMLYDNKTNLGPLYLCKSYVHTCHPMRDIGEILTEEAR